MAIPRGAPRALPAHPSHRRQRGASRAGGRPARALGHHGRHPRRQAPLVARGAQERAQDARRAVRRDRRQCAPRRARPAHGRLAALRHPAAVGGGVERHGGDRARAGRPPLGLDDDARREALRLDGRPRAAPEAGREARVGGADPAHPAGRPGRVARRGRGEPVGGGERRPAQPQVRREPRDGARVRRLQAARRVPLPEGEQQRRLPARPPRGADRGQRRPRADQRAVRRRLRLHRPHRDGGAPARRVADVRHHARRPADHGGRQRQDRHLRPRDSRHHRRRARRRRGGSRSAHAPGRPRPDRVPQHHADARSLRAERCAGAAFVWRRRRSV